MKKYNVTVNGTTYEVKVETVGCSHCAKPVVQEITPVAEVPKRRIQSRQEIKNNVQMSKETVKAATRSMAEEKLNAKVEEKPAAAPAGAVTGKPVLAPMPGKIVKVVVNVGDVVSEGDLLLVLEAMKMQNEITAQTAGVVQSINVEAGQNVKVKEQMLVIG